MEFTLGNISIRPGHNRGDLWLENARTGEGMQIREAVLMKNLEEFFDKHF